MSDPLDSPENLKWEAGPHVILMLHGLGATPLELTRLAQDASQEGFSVRIPSIDGYAHGTDPMPWEHWVDQVRIHYEACWQSHETVSVLGVSMGATLGLHLAQSASPAGLVALSAALAYDGWAIPWYHDLISWADWIPFSDHYQYVEQEPFGVKNPETRRMIKRMLQANQISEVGAAKIPLALLVEGKKLMRATVENAEKICDPVLFMHAVDDESVHIRNPELLYQRVSSEVREFIYLGDSYHMITIDNERDLVRKESLRFLKAAVNRHAGGSVFDVPDIQSYELRRQLEAR